MSRKRIFLVPVLFAVIAFSAWIMFSSHRYLTARAQRYPLPTGWSTSDPSFARLGHCWISNLTLLAPREVTTDNYEFVQLDLASGKTTPLKRVEALFQGINLRGESSVWDTSPDGRHLFVANGDATNATVIVGDLDGSRRGIWQMTYFDENFVWLSESAGLIVLEEKQSNCVVRIIRFDSPTVQEIHVPQLADTELLGFTEERTLLMREHPNAWSVGSQSEVKLSEWKLDSTLSRIREMTIELPQPCDHADVMLSPRGDRLAWNLFSTRKRFPFVHARRFPFVRARLCLQQSLWVSNSDGRRMRKLGDFEPSVVVEVAWTPDGEHLEFLRQNVVHLVQVK
jgi:hypothetical protein